MGNTPRRFSGILTAGLALFALAGCVHNPPLVEGVPASSPSPEVFWTPPVAGEGKSAVAGGVVPLEDLQDKLNRLTLSQVVDLTLRNNPATRAAWADARAAAAKYGSSLGAWYPTVSVDAEILRSNGVFPLTSPGKTATSYGPVANLSYLLFDFGGRTGAVE